MDGMTRWGLAWARSGGWGYIALVALLLALLGPYGTFISMSLSTRLLFWGASALGLALLVKAAMALISRGLLPAAWPRAVKRIAAAGLAAAPGGYLAALLNDVLTGRDSRSESFFLLYAYTIMPTLLVTLLLGRRQEQPSASPVAPDPLETAGARNAEAIVAAFLVRVMPRFAGGRLLALEAEDHYLRIHTDRGDDLVLMRLRDAVTELAGVPGLQVHRSFWVAEAGVSHVARRGASWQVILESGLAVPVSRNYGADLRAAGWPDRFGAPVDLSGRVRDGAAG